MIGKTLYEPVTGKIVFPDIKQLEKKTLEELKQLRITKISTYNAAFVTCGFTLSDGQSCRAGKDYDFSNHYEIDQTKRLRKIEVIFEKRENFIS